MSSQSFSITAFVLSLIGGIIIVLGGLVFVLSLLFYPNGWPFGGWVWMMMGGYGYGYASGLLVAFSIIGLVSGIIVIAGALMLNSRPTEYRAWGVVILVFSMVSFLGAGMSFMGAILGLAGGALALSYKRKTT